MLNPSTADAFRVDPTITRCIRHAHRWRCGGLVIVNLFALRATNPTALAGHPDPVGPDNDQVITDVLTVAGHGPVIVAWGCDKILRRTGRDAQVVRYLRASGRPTEALRITKGGFPQHPLYVPADTTPVPYTTTHIEGRPA